MSGVLITFCCSDKIPGSRQLIEIRVYFGLRLQRDRRTSWLVGMAESVTGMVAGAGC